MWEAYLRYPLSLSSKAATPTVTCTESQGSALTAASFIHHSTNNLFNAISVLFLNNTNSLSKYKTKNILLLSRLEVQMMGGGVHSFARTPTLGQRLWAPIRALSTLILLTLSVPPGHFYFICPIPVKKQEKLGGWLPFNIFHLFLPSWVWTLFPAYFCLLPIQS